MTCVFIGKTRGHANSHREQVGRQVVWESHRRPVVAFDSPGCIWLAVGLGAGTLQPRPANPRSFSRQARSRTQKSGMLFVLVSPKDLL
jgi:hypothetical protein